jgi:polyisoprenoid-binding protein YceI
MKKQILLSALLLLSIVSLINAQTNYKADIFNSKINWLGRKVTGEHSGIINLSSGEFTLDKGMIVKARFEVDMNSIKDLDLTDEGYKAKLEGHLKSEDFFNVANYPKSIFILDKAVKIEKGITLIKGNITIKGITQPIEIKTVFSDTKEGMRIYASITIDRTKFNLKYGSGTFFENLGDKTIYDDFDLTISLLATKQ